MKNKIINNEEGKYMNDITYEQLQEIIKKYNNHIISTEEALKEVEPYLTKEIIEKLGITDKMYLISIRHCCIVEPLKYTDDINEIIEIYNSNKYDDVYVSVKFGKEWLEYFYHLNDGNIYQLKLCEEALRPIVNQ